MRSMTWACGSTGAEILDLLALDLPLDGLEDALLHRVLVLLGLEARVRGLLDELQRELDLLVLHLRVVDLDLVERADLVGVVELLQEQPAGPGADEGEVLLAAGGVARDRGLAALLEREREELVGLAAALVRAEVVGLLEVDRVDLGGGHELGDVDRLGRDLVERLQLLAREGDVAVLRELVALHHLVAFDLLAVLRARVVLLQARAVLRVEQVEGDGRRGLRRRVEAHGDRDEPEGDGAGGDGARGHARSIIEVRASARPFRWRPISGSERHALRGARRRPKRPIAIRKHRPRA
ncbi:MAG: hypothetical protein QM704_26290 [Anaeromyxobacteraceae bacterium]